MSEITDIATGSIANGDRIVFWTPGSPAVLKNLNVTTELAAYLNTGAFTFQDDTRVTFNPGVTNAGVNVGAHTADPSSLVDGDLWYNSTDNTLSAYINGAVVDVGSGSGGDFMADGSVPMTGSLDLGANNIINSGAVQITATEDILSFSEGAGPNVNNIDIQNAETGAGPQISAVGTDANIDIEVNPKGTGNINLNSPVVIPTGDALTLGAAQIFETGADLIVSATTNGTVNVDSVGTGDILISAGGTGDIVLTASGGVSHFAIGANNSLTIASTDTRVQSDMVLGWSSSATNSNTAADTGLTRLSAGIVGVGDGTNGDTTGTFRCRNVDSDLAYVMINDLVMGELSYESVTASESYCDTTWRTLENWNVAGTGVGLTPNTSGVSVNPNQIYMDVGGKFLILFQVSFTGSTNDTFWFEANSSDNHTASPVYTALGCMCQRELGSTSATGSASFVGIASLNQGEGLLVRQRCAAGTATLSIVEAQLVAIRIGD